MIEISPVEYWKTDLNWHEAKFYCFCLNIDGKTGWHLPDYRCFSENQSTILNLSGRDKHTWYWSSSEVSDRLAMQVTLPDLGTIDWNKNDKETVTMPVRDLKDD